ncbi:MAG: hypothetical protein ABW189_07095 [Rickettsiales bacterium]
MMRAPTFALAAAATCILFSSQAYAKGDVRNPFLRKLVEETPVALHGEHTDAPANREPRNVAPDAEPGDDVASEIMPGRADPGMRDPLLLYGVRDFRVVGTLSADQEQIAALKAKGKETMFVRVGDMIGAERYVVKAIDVGGALLAKGESAMRLPVRNPTMEDVYDTQKR